MPDRQTHATVVLGRGDRDVATWPLRVRGRPGLAVVDELARLQLAARRLGWAIRLRDASAELVELLDLAGLRREMVGKAERGEEARVDEVVVPDDPVA